MKMSLEILDEIMVIMDFFGNVIYMVLLFLLIGEDVLIIGVGFIGSMVIVIVCFVGVCYVIVIEISSYCVEIVKKLGVICVVNLLEEDFIKIMKDFGMFGFDIGLECFGVFVVFN